MSGSVLKALSILQLVLVAAFVLYTLDGRNPDRRADENGRLVS